MNQKDKQTEIVILSEDFRHIVSTSKGRKLDILRFCAENADPYFLNDKEPVLIDLNQDQFLGIFYYGTSHYFLSTEQIARLGDFLKLKLVNLIALMIKSEWEKFYFKLISYENKPETSNEEKLKDIGLASKYLVDFNPSKDSIYKQILNVSHLASSAKSRKGINLLIEDMINEGHFLDKNALMGRHYPEKEGNEVLLLEKATETLKKKYKNLKVLWKKKQTELEDKLLFLEKKKKLNQNWENSYFRTFGPQEYKTALLRQKAEKYRIVLDLKKGNPSLTFKSALKQALEKLSEMDNEIARVKNCYSRSLNCYIGFQGGGAREITLEELADYEEAIKELMVKLLFILHTDTCPFPNLTQNQQSGMSKLWIELMASKKEIYSYSPGMMMFTFPDYNRLYSILLKACKIFNVQVEDLDFGDRLELLIRKGSSIEEIIDFLNKDTRHISLHLTNLEIIEEEYTNEKLAGKYKSGLESVEDHNNKLGREIHALSDEIIELKANIKEEFSLRTEKILHQEPDK